MSHFFPQLGWELFRLAARRRTWLGFGLFLAVEIIFLVIFTSKRSQDGMRRFFETMSGSFEDYFSALTVGFMIMAFTLFLLSAISVALVAGDILAKESEDGNLRIILSRPVSRFQLLLVKYCACHIYATTLCFFVAVTAFLVGTIDRGWGGGMLVWSPAMPRVSLFDWNTGMARYFLAVGGFALFYLPVTSLAFFFGCCRMKPASATILTIGILFGDWVLSKIPLAAFDPWRDWFFASRMERWLLLVSEQIPWARFFENAAWLVGSGLALFVIGWIVFERRDIKA